MTAKTRIIQIDILRGIALLGILLVNIALFSQPLAVALAGSTTYLASDLDRILKLLIELLFTGKFYPLFALLFGFGIYTQYSRLAGSKNFNRFAIRRMLFLLVVGILHVSLLWAGDILIAYAILGLGVIACVKIESKTILVMAIMGILLTFILTLMSLVALTLFIFLPDQPSLSVISSADNLQVIRIFSQGTFMEIIAHRISDWLELFSSGMIAWPQVFGMMLLGVFAGKQSLLDPAKHVHLRRKILLLAFPLGLAIGLLAMVVGQAFAGEYSLLGQGFANALTILGGPLLAISYICLILNIGSAGLKLLQPVSYLGRMSLSNYIMQSLIATTLFYSYGFGFFGKLSLHQTLLVALAIYAFQLLFSWVYFRIGKFRQGPLEWIFGRLIGREALP
jgi:uncharacterized protein